MKPCTGCCSPPLAGSLRGFIPFPKLVAKETLRGTGTDECSNSNAYTSPQESIIYENQNEYDLYSETWEDPDENILGPSCDQYKDENLIITQEIIGTGGTGGVTEEYDISVELNTNFIGNLNDCSYSEFGTYKINNYEIVQTRYGPFAGGTSDENSQIITTTRITGSYTGPPEGSSVATVTEETVYVGFDPPVPPVFDTYSITISLDGLGSPISGFYLENRFGTKIIKHILSSPQEEPILEYSPVTPVVGGSGSISPDVGRSANTFLTKSKIELKCSPPPPLCYLKIWPILKISERDVDSCGGTSFPPIIRYETPEPLIINVTGNPCINDPQKSIESEENIFSKEINFIIRGEDDWSNVELNDEEINLVYNLPVGKNVSIDVEIWKYSFVPDYEPESPSLGFPFVPNTTPRTRLDGYFVNGVEPTLRTSPIVYGQLTD